ncbi:putative cytochrome b-c1 complex, subunit 6, ubiquinol-cytochrome C reductase hinge [Dioscorea sansibarensis]
MGLCMYVSIVKTMNWKFVFLPIFRADDEIVDPKKYLEDRCQPKCVKALFEYQACVKRVQDDETGHKHCTGQYFDYWSCIDKCVAPKLFEKTR